MPLKVKHLGRSLRDEELLPILVFVQSRLEAAQVPTLREICAQFGLSSVSVASYRLRVMEERGWLTWRRGIIRLTKAGLLALGREDTPSLMKAAVGALGLLYLVRYIGALPAFGDPLRVRSVIEGLEKAIVAAGGELPSNALDEAGASDARD